MAEVMRLPRLSNKFLFFKQSKMTEDVRFTKNFLSQHLVRLYRVFPKCGQTPSRTLPARRSGANSAKTISMSKRNEHHLAFSSFTSSPCSSPCTTGITKPVYAVNRVENPAPNGNGFLCQNPQEPGTGSALLSICLIGMTRPSKQ